MEGIVELSSVVRFLCGSNGPGAFACSCRPEQPPNSNICPAYSLHIGSFSRMVSSFSPPRTYSTANYSYEDIISEPDGTVVELTNDSSHCFKFFEKIFGTKCFH
jgi:hypothetical protein